MKWLPGAMSENIYEGKFTYLIARKGTYYPTTTYIIESDLKKEYTDSIFVLCHKIKTKISCNMRHARCRNVIFVASDSFKDSIFDIFILIVIKSNTKITVCFQFPKGMTKEEEVHPWSRVIEQPLVQKNNLICRLCTERGKLEEVLFRKARSTMKKDLSKDDFMKTRAVFKYAKSLKCGDRAQFILDEPKTTTDTDDNDVIADESEQ